MDFLDFDNHDLYFDEPLAPEDEMLLQKAAEAYPEKETEIILQDLRSRLPDSLTVIVALYRFYYYQHRYPDALYIAAKALEVSGTKLGIRLDWKDLTKEDLGTGVLVSMGLLRFYILSLKASAYLFMRIGQIEQANERLKKIVELDPSDQFGVQFLFKIAEKEICIKQAEQNNITSIFKKQNQRG